MSNEEKKKRLNYRVNRKKWINFQTVLIIILTIITAFSAVTYHRRDKESYIQYIEKSDVDYKVYLKENSFFLNDFTKNLDSDIFFDLCLRYPNLKKYCPKNLKEELNLVIDILKNN